MAAQKQKPETKRKKLSPSVATDLSGMPREAEETVVARPPGKSRKVTGQSEEETEAWSLVETFDGRLTEAEKRMDRILARLGVE